MRNHSRKRAFALAALLLPAALVAEALSPEEQAEKERELQALRKTELSEAKEPAVQQPSHAEAERAANAEEQAERRAEHLASELSSQILSPAQTPPEAKDPLDLLRMRHLAGQPLSPAEKEQLLARFPTQPRQVRKGGQGTDESWGPDEYGYSAYDQDEENGMPFAWIDPVAEEHTELWPGLNQDDTFSDWMTLPFSFPFYDDTVDQVRFSANGVIMVGNEGATPSFSYRLPDDVSDYRLIDPWSLDMYHKDTSHLYYGAMTEPDRFVVTWVDLAGYTDRDNVQTFQVILYGNGDIQFQYDLLDDTGALCESSGIDHTGTRGLNVGDASAHYQGQSILFNLVPPDYGVTAEPALITQTGGPGDVLNASFTITNRGQLEDSYALAVTQDLVDVTLSYQGTPIGNTGTLQPEGSITIDVIAMIDGEMGTYEDAALVSIDSDNADVSATVDVLTSVVNAAGGGPDIWGNTWSTDEHFWVDLPEEDRTYVTDLGDDSVSGPFPMNGSLNFYGDAYSQVYVGSNGYYGFDPTSMTSLSNQELPNATFPNNLLALFWDDLDPADGGQVYYGNDESGRFILTYDGVIEYPSGPGNVVAQSVIDFENGSVYHNYSELADGIDLSSCTIGIENSDGSDGLTVVFNSQPFLPFAPWTIRFDLIIPDYASSANPNPLLLGGGPGDVLSGTVSVFNAGTQPDSYSLAATEDVLGIQLLVDGEPASNTGTIDPAGSASFEVEVTIPEEIDTFTDNAFVLISSDNSEDVINLAVTTAVVNASGGGPDAWGNSWTSSAGGDVDYFWVDLPEEDRTYLTLASNGVAGPLELGGALSFYGDSYSQLYVGSNGIYGFSPTGMASGVNQSFPAVGTPNNLFALFWDFLDPAAGGQVYYGTDDQDRFVLTFDEVAESFAPGSITAQAVFDFAAGQVYQNYQSLANGLDLDNCTIGFENGAGDDGLNVLIDGAPFEPLPEWTVRFDLIIPEYTVSANPDPLGMSGGPGDVIQSSFTLFNGGLVEDSYTLTLTEDQLEIEITIDGQPAGNTGVIAPQASLVVDVMVTIPEETGTFTDNASVSIDSDNSEAFLDLALITSVINAAGGGPDAWGNTWISSAGGDVDYFWVDLPEEDRTYITDLGDDSVSGPFEMNGTISFYGNPYSSVYVGSNGVYGFDQLGLNSLGNENFPDPSTPNNCLALFWDDLDPADGGQVYYGNDEDGRFVLTYDGVIEYPSGPGNVVAQSVFDFESGYVFHNYNQLADGIDLSSCTIGIENSDGSDGLTVLYNNDPFPPASQWTVRFSLGAPPDYFPVLEDGVNTAGGVDSQVTVPVSVTNNGLVEDSFVIAASGTSDVEVQVLINGTPGNTTPTVQPLEAFEFELEFDIPEVPADIQYVFDVTATSSGDPSRQDATTVSLTVVPVQGGPDEYGYFWSTTDADGQVEYDWVELDSPNPAPATDDGFAGPFDIGFTWNHYGVDYTQVWIGSNGMIGFAETGMNSLGNQQLPNTSTPNAVIAMFWDDLDPDSNNDGTIEYGTQDGLFVVNYLGVPEFPGGQTSGRITAQVILDPDEEAVRINYQNFENDLDMLSATIGQENADGTQGFWCNYNSQGWMPTPESAVWFGFNVIGPSGPYAVDIDPSEQDGVGVNGEYAEYTFEVENRGENPSAFSIESEGHIWDVTWHDVDAAWAEITAIPELAYDEVFNLGVRHFVPEEPESFTDLAVFTVTSTVEETAFAEASFLTAASCTHIEQLTQNLTGNGLFGMVNLSDGEGMGDGQILWNASSVNRFVMQDSEDGSATTISAMTAGHDYQGIAWDSRDNTVWVSYLAGISHKNTDGSTIASFEPAILAEGTGRMPMGLAYDADSEILWAVCSNAGFDEVVRIDISDPANPVDLSAEVLPWSGGVPGAAGADYDEGSDQLLLVNRSTGSMECFLDLGNGQVEPRGDFCPSGLEDVHGIALHTDGTVFLGATNGLAHPVEHYMAPCAVTDVASGPALPERFELGANYPNPFNPSTMLRVALPQAGQVKLEVYNLLGQRQSLLWNDRLDAGWHEFRFDGSALASGVYFYRVTVADNGGASLYSDVRKMMLMK